MSTNTTETACFDDIMACIEELGFLTPKPYLTVFLVVGVAAMLYYSYKCNVSHEDDDSALEMLGSEFKEHLAIAREYRAMVTAASANNAQRNNEQAANN